MARSRGIAKFNHLQLRLPAELRQEIGAAASRLGIMVADVVRGALHFGLPVFAAMTGVQDEVARRLVMELKRRSRKARKKKRKCDIR